MQRVGDHITELVRALGNRVTTCAQVEVEGPSDVREDAANGAELYTVVRSVGHAEVQNHGLVIHCVAQSRDAKKLSKEEAIGLAMLATVLAAVDVAETHMTSPVKQTRGASQTPTEGTPRYSHREQSVHGLLHILAPIALWGGRRREAHQGCPTTVRDGKATVSACEVSKQTTGST